VPAPAPLLIAGKDLRQRLRDRSAIVVGLVAPLLIAALMSVAFKGADTFHFTLGVVDADHGPVASGLVKALHEAPLDQVVTVRNLPSRSAAAAAVRENHAQAALVIPPGFSAAVEQAQPRSLSALTSVNNQAAANVTTAVAHSFVSQLNADRLSIATALDAGAPQSQAAALESVAARLQIPEQMVQRPVGSQPLKVISYYGPAMAIFFLFFTISYTARSFFVDRSTGMIERMRTAPIRPYEILFGKVLSAFVFGLASLGVIALVTTLVFGANWGNPLGAGLVCIAMVLAVVCVTALVIGLSRTQRQAEGIASAVVFGLALLGGNFVFISSLPDVMRRIALFTPNGQALRAFTDMATTGSGLGSVMTPVLVILGFSFVVGLFAVLLSRRAVES
jgi:linearmycin/streptolysin S transport system permease protein